MLNKFITQESYQITAPEFAKNVASLAPLQSIEKFINLLPSHSKIIDLGCGSGRDAAIFTKMGVDVLGIDFCSNLIDFAKQQAPLAKFEIMDIQDLSLPHHSFDGVWAACSLSHIAKTSLPKVLNNIYNILKPGGYFYLSLKKGDGEGLEQDSRYQGDIRKFWSFYQSEELRTALTIASFEILELTEVECNHPYLTRNAFRVFCQKV